VVCCASYTPLTHFVFCSLLGQGYSLEELLKAAEETKKIRASRRASMKGTNWDKFKRLGMRIMNKTNAQKTQTAPKIYAARTG